MKILSVDTSTAVMSVAVLDEEKVIAEYSNDNKKMHSQKLMPSIDEILSSCKIAIGEIDCFAAAVGPGSFTGLRIGVCTIKGLAYALKKPTVGVCTLDGLAANIFCENMLVCPVIDARNEQVYTAVYKYDNGKKYPERLTEYMAVPVAELIDIVHKMNKSVIFLGDAVGSYGEKIKEGLGSKCFFAPQEMNFCRAYSVGMLALEKLRRGETLGSEELVPFYLRQSQAERKFGCV